jgi:hypothetical protein
MAVRAQSAHAVPRFFTLYLACTPCTASITHAAWVIDTCRRGIFKSRPRMTALLADLEHIRGFVRRNDQPSARISPEVGT